MRVITTIHNSQKNAGPKAPRDINTIMQQEYSAKCVEILRINNFKYKVLIEFIKAAISKDVVLLQYPLVYKPSLYKMFSPNRTILLIHDMIGLRNQDEETTNKEISIISMFKYVIVHNQRMKQYLVDNGVDPDNLYVLEIFDYLANGDISLRSMNTNQLTVVYPGNLTREKSPFIYELDSSKMNFTLNIYGLGIEKSISDRIVYQGSFDPEDLNLEGDVGLVWDGSKDESDENLTFKNYTKYNNPHKLSCCLASGLPVIVWEKAAIADFVKANNVGYTISQLSEINEIDFSDLHVKQINAYNVGKRIREGYYTKKVVKEILSKM